MPEPRNHRFFTLGEAERILPQVEAVLRNVIQLGQDGERSQTELRQWLQRIAMSGGGLVDHSGALERKSRLQAIAARLQDAVAQLEGYGCLIKDLKLGLVDFPTLFRGKEVYLCWKLGEESIRYWHGIDEGFTGRKPIDADFVQHHGGASGKPLH